ncbi:MAG: hypothetical protein ACYCSF_07305 [Acidimicrobiales bacterium]
MVSQSFSGQVVDTSSVEEFLREVRARAAEPEITVIEDALSAKSAGFERLLGDPRRVATAEELRRVLRSIFSTRRRATSILQAVGADALGSAIKELLHGEAAIEERLARFETSLSAVPAVPFDMAFELLHFTRPDRFWLWTPWIFDPRAETGALRLVVTDDVELFAEDRAATYLRVGSALAFLHENTLATGTSGLSNGPFAVDVLLACVYAVYMYTVLRMRMTQEFTRIVPTLPELVRRLLGVQDLEV